MQRSSRRIFFMWSAFLLEIPVLIMLFSAALLVPIPFGWARTSCIIATLAVSFALAYSSSLQYAKRNARTKPRLRNLLLKPPFIVWFLACLFIAWMFIGFASVTWY